MSPDSVASSTTCGANARRTGASRETGVLSDLTWLKVDFDLQKVMYVAIELLGMLRWLHHDARQSPQIRADITAVARWINFLMDQREHIACEIAEPRPEVAKLKGRFLCEKCMKCAKDNYGKTVGYEVSAPPPIWKTQLDFLLACTERVGVELFEQDCASCDLRKFPDCLAKLANAALRLRRYLSSMGAGEMRMGVEPFPDSCDECGQPINPPPEALL
jgi:hypothetical protein